MGRGPSQHMLMGVDKETERGRCLECGDVQVVRVSKKDDRWACGPGVKARKLRKRYGITDPDLARKLAKSEDSKCAICGDQAGGKSLSLDHCHETGLVRGFLCPHCNMGLGHFKDDPQRLRAAARYLLAATRK